MGRRDDILQRLRQNHTLEHATIHLLARRARGVRLLGRSDWNGFTIYGNVETDDVVDAVTEGLTRGRRRPWARLLGTGVALVAGLVLAGPLGSAVQRHVTTSADMEGAYLQVVTRDERGGVLRHRVQVGHVSS
jgi:hypothetical protein